MKNVDIIHKKTNAIPSANGHLFVPQNRKRSK